MLRSSGRGARTGTGEAVCRLQAAAVHVTAVPALTEKLALAVRVTTRTGAGAAKVAVTV
jgi:hypothetical protein